MAGKVANTRGSARDLPRFTGYGNCGRTDDDVVQRPDQVDQQGHRTGIRIKTKF